MVTAPRIHCRRTPLQTREPGWHSSMLSPCLSSCASLLLPSPFSSNEPIVHCREASCRRSRPTFARLQSQGCEASAKRPAEGLARLLRGCSRRVEHSERQCISQEQRSRPWFIAPSTMRRAPCRDRCARSTGQFRTNTTHIPPDRHAVRVDHDSAVQATRLASHVGCRQNTFDLTTTKHYDIIAHGL